MEPTITNREKPFIPGQEADGKAVGRKGVIKLGRGSTKAKSVVKQTIRATLATAKPITESHTIKKGADPATEFRELKKQSKKAFRSQQVLDPKKDKFHAPFTNVPCIRQTAVEVEGRFLHANNVLLNEHIPFIACSAPQTQDRELFWRAVCANADNIIDVSGLGEVEGYFPEEVGKKIVLGQMSITCESAGPPHKYLVHDGNSDTEKVVTRIHFSKWPDHGVVTVKELEGLVHSYEQFCVQDTPTLVHCRAGLGRTGTMMVAVALKDLYDKGQLTKENAFAKVKELILEARGQRGPDCVQEVEQFTLLCDYAKKLTTDGPEKDFNVHELLTDDRKITTTAKALELINKIAEKKATPDEQNLLSSALKIVADALATGALKDDAKQALVGPLQAIRVAVLSEHDVSAGYVSEVTEAKSSMRPLNAHEKNMLNYTQMLLETKIPQEVRDHDGYVSTALFAIDSQAIDRIHLPVEELKSRAIKNALLVLRGAHGLDSSKTHYILTPSTTASGPEDIEPFTIRVIRKDGKTWQERLVKSGENSWQQLKVDDKNNPDYKGLKSQQRHSSLEALINHVLQDPDAVYITKDTVLQQKEVQFGAESFEMTDLLLRGLCEAPRLFEEAVGSGMPFIIPDRYPPAVTSSCFDTLRFGVPLSIPQDPQEQRIWLKSAGELADFLGCSLLKRQVSLEIMHRYQSETCTLTPTKDPLTSTATVKVGQDIVKMPIQISNTGGFCVAKSNSAYPSLDRLIDDIILIETHQKLFKSEHRLNITSAKSTYPNPQFQVELTIGEKTVSEPLRIAKDGTYSIGGKEGLKTLDEVVVVLKNQIEKLKQAQNRLQSMPCFEPMASEAVIASLAPGACMLWQDGPEFRLTYCEQEEPHARKTLGISLRPEGIALLELPEKGKPYVRGAFKESVEALVGQINGISTKKYVSLLQQQATYQGEISEGENMRLLKDPGCCLLRTTSNPSSCLFCYKNKDGKIRKQNVTISDQGIQVVGGTNWYKTPEALMKRLGEPTCTPVLNNKGILLKVVQDGPAQAVKNNLCKRMVELSLNSQPKIALGDLLELISDQKEIRLPTLHDLEAEAKVQMHSEAIKLLKALGNPESLHYEYHEVLNESLDLLGTLISESGGLTKEEKETFSGPLVAALEQARPEIWLTTDHDRALNQEFKRVCTVLWQQLGLGEFQMEFKNE